jgi:hypothetical protein
MAVSGVAHPQSGQPATVFYPSGHPTLYAYDFLSPLFLSLDFVLFSFLLDFVRNFSLFCDHRFWLMDGGSDGGWWSFAGYFLFPLFRKRKKKCSIFEIFTKKASSPFVAYSANGDSMIRGTVNDSI